MSLVISQTQEVHEQIVDLLNQLRRLQDLQVTIEVRYITLNDNFFERIGVDFQAEHHRRRRIASPAAAPNTSLTVGLNPPAVGGTFSELHQRPGDSVHAVELHAGHAAVRQPQDVANFGFAILSDIEAYFLVNASQGDTRTNILQAPKVTLFNGQTASVSDTTQTPFVISVIPVVGNFAVAQEPVIVVLNEGTFLTVQAVISNDRRFVRLTVVPFFSKIGDVTEFTFSGSSTTTNNTSTSNSATAGGDTTASNSDDNTDDQHRRHRAVALVLLRHRDDHRQRARRRHRAVGRHQTFERGPQRIRRADLEQAALHQPSVHERRHRPPNAKPDDDGHAANHHSGRGRRTLGHRRAS